MKNSIIFLFTLLLYGYSTMAQYQVSTCAELDLNPGVMGVSGDRVEILSIYLEGTDDGVGGLGCWVHHHPNGKDYVVTPHSWGKEPTPGKMGLIKDAMDAITDSRNLYVRYGTLESNLYYILDDRLHGDAEGEKFWYVDGGNECWMRSGVPAMRWESTCDERKHIFAHEIGHCFVEENVPKTDDLTDIWLEWMDESVAEYLASEVYKQSNCEHEYSVTYDYDAPFIQPYDAYVLWYHYAKKNGIDKIVPLMNQLAGLKSDRARLTYLRSIGFDKSFHDFLYDFTNNQIMDSGTRQPIPKPGDGFDDAYVLNPAETKIDLPESIQNSQREFFLISLPKGFNVTLRPPRGSAQPFFKSLFAEGLELKDWDSEQYIEGNCERDTSVLVMLSHLNDEDLEGLSLSYELEVKTDCCGGAEGSLDGCLVGTWEVDVSTISHLIDYDVSGTLRVTFENAPAGHLEATFDLQFNFDNGDYDTHKGKVSACVVPMDSGGRLNYFKLLGVSLGSGNIHTHYYSRRGKQFDITQDVKESLERYKFNYTTCTPDILTVLYLIRMSRIR